MTALRPGPSPPAGGEPTHRARRLGKSPLGVVSGALLGARRIVELSRAS